jgi:hypothetical protein
MKISEHIKAIQPCAILYGGTKANKNFQGAMIKFQNIVVNLRQMECIFLDSGLSNCIY